MHVCAGQRWGVAQPRLSPVSMCQPIPLFLCVTDRHVDSCQAQVAPINGRPTALSDVKCACPVDKIWSGICLSGDIKKEF